MWWRLRGSTGVTRRGSPKCRSKHFWPSYSDFSTGEERECILSAEEFLRRFLQHVLPKGFRRIRTYGWLSPAAKASACRVPALLGPVSSPQTNHSPADQSSSRGKPARVQILCPHCRKPMRRTGHLGRAPPPPNPWLS